MEVITVRRMDSLGRLVLPIEVRRRAEIDLDSPLEVGMDDAKQIILRKAAVRCAVCDSDKQLLVLGKKALCGECLAQFEGELKVRTAEDKGLK